MQFACDFEFKMKGSIDGEMAFYGNLSVPKLGQDLIDVVKL